MNTLKPVRHAIKEQKEVPPTHQALRPPQMKAGVLHVAAGEEFLNSALRSNFLERLLGVNDGERNEDGSRPGGNLVNVEPEPIRKEHDFRRNRRNGIPVVLTKKAEINFGVG